MNKDSDGLSITMDLDNGFVTQHVFEKYKDLQAQLLKKDQELCTLQGTIDSAPFACVLVDGDGAVFLEEYINQGEQGGKTAGDMLYDGIKKYLQTDGELWRLGITKIMVQVYLNVDGLGRALQNAGLVRSQHTDPSRQLTLFGRGFNKAQMLFSFIDVGREKEAADHKIRAVFELMERNLHCKCLILAGCHDGGYGRLLDTYEFKYRSQPPSHKIRLLETTPTPEWSVYRTAHYLDAFPRLSLPDVFRSERVDTSRQVYNPFYSQPNTILPPRKLLSQNLIPSSSPFPHAAHLNNALYPSASLNSQPTNLRSQTQDYPNALVLAARTSQDREVQEIDAQNQPWQHLFPQIQVQQPETVQHPHERVSLNKLREELRLKNLHGAIAFKQQRFCNKWHIDHSCPATRGKSQEDAELGLGCTYIHGKPLEPRLLTEVRYNARNLKCGKRWGCRDVDCHMGHHCFNPSICDYPTCKFMDGHNVLFDLNPAWKVYPDGSAERVDEFGPSGQ
ncbi:hypothetical protein V8F33_011937 [Rhypophila sp. PSN 637]